MARELKKALKEAIEYEKGNINLPARTRTTVKNKYNLKPKDINKLVILDRTQLKEPMFWRNNVIDAWCISKSIGSAKDKRFCTDNSVWIGIYDEDAKAYKNKVRYSCDCYGGMCSYQFDKFFDPSDIENDNDFASQVFLLETINNLIDLGILGLPTK